MCARYLVLCMLSPLPPPPSLSAMWSLVLPLIALPSLALAAPTGAAHHGQQNPVCIIGAGPAGLAAAGRLQDKGISAVMFDRQDQIGGKCQSWYDDQ